MSSCLFFRCPIRMRRGRRSSRTRRSNNEDLVRPTIKDLGGDILISWLCPGEDYDVLAVLDLPDEATANAALMVFKAGGALRKAKCRAYNVGRGHAGHARGPERAHFTGLRAKPPKKAHTPSQRAAR